LLPDASAENDEDNEEVFAENYDERDDHQSSLSTTPKKVHQLSPHPLILLSSIF
jgi:hypothetical protein